MSPRSGPYAYIAPYFLLFAVFGLFPLLYTAWVSMQDRNLLDGDDTKAAWTTVNAAEAMPGVSTPLAWTWWQPAISGFSVTMSIAAFIWLWAVPTQGHRL